MAAASGAAAAGVSFRGRPRAHTARGPGVLLEPMIQDTKMVSEARRIQFGAVHAEGRQQPKTPKRRIFD